MFHKVGVKANPRKQWAAVNISVTIISNICTLFGTKVHFPQEHQGEEQIVSGLRSFCLVFSTFKTTLSDDSRGSFTP